MPLLEVCVESVEGLEAALEGGADRIELCSSLGVGGLTPSAGFMKEAVTISSVPVHALIRPRSGDFHFSPAEFSAMKHDIDTARDAGIAGVVIGASRTDQRLDVAGLASLVEAAVGLDLTLHRAFDLVPDFDEALSIAIDLGFSRILTSGGAPSALEGIDVLRRLVNAGQKRISIMPGSGVSAQNVGDLLALGAIHEVHASCSRVVAAAAAASQSLKALGFVAERETRTDAEKVRALKAAMAL